ncbi:TIGR01440 family protein [Hydrogenibacillus schlegelii]|uniref:UPF0340 protein HSCHL_0132 n=1 Tax=Hydrogenibacillus schlegelii TaxID=1484 RepID=A0A132NDJ1_HYDSH|nr:TIGR01440 family protein [Hydrogenibacillus schlegelii]KWX08173.1 hypothetical protein TR75_01145 [Hydrogenibacillus schlegelii]MBT9282172.1 TIGR01440 family protein [Hydrogenibacillus schlegelii]PTQ54553.1 MAG: hypothetical protein HSCHL_0132 [Hydrogenibacillus schlegelii]
MTAERPPHPAAEAGPNPADPGPGADLVREIEAAVAEALKALLERRPLGPKHLFVVGASTSEIAGGPIGKRPTLAYGEAIVRAVEAVREHHGFHTAYQCCEHLNRALVVRRETLEAFGLEEVTVRPVPEAGGALATAAYDLLPEAVCVEAVRADAGLDIGETLIGMHLKPVVVPFRPPRRTVGAARMTLAYSRPKLIGGPRARYPEPR